MATKPKKTNRMVVRNSTVILSPEQLVQSMNKLLHRAKNFIHESDPLLGDIKSVLLLYAEYEAQREEPKRKKK